MPAQEPPRLSGKVAVVAALVFILGLLAAITLLIRPQRPAPHAPPPVEAR